MAGVVAKGRSGAQVTHSYTEGVARAGHSLVGMRGGRRLVHGGGRHSGRRKGGPALRGPYGRGRAGSGAGSGWHRGRSPGERTWGRTSQGHGDRQHGSPGPAGPGVSFGSERGTEGGADVYLRSDVSVIDREVGRRGGRNWVNASPRPGLRPGGDVSSGKGGVGAGSTGCSRCAVIENGTEWSGGAPEDDTSKYGRSANSASEPV